MRVLIITNIAAPYRLELFNHSHGSFERFHVAFQAEREPGRSWARPATAFDSSVLKGIRMRLGNRDILVNWGVSETVKRVAPHVVIVAGFSPLVLQVLRICKRTRARVILMNDGTPETDPVSGPEYWYRRCLVALADGFIGACSRSAEYFRLLGAEARKVAIVELTTDLQAIRRAACQEHRRSKARERLHLTPRVVCTAGKLVPGKCTLDAIMAYERARERIQDLCLVVAGEGPLEEALRAYVGSRSIAGVHFLGHLGWEGMLDLYSVSDILLFPAVRERFGMVIIEALASGVPVIATLQAGASHDLLRDGENGFIVPPGDVSAMSDAIVRFFETPGLPSRMSNEACKVVDAHDVTSEAGIFSAYICGVGQA